jgi:alpha-galactosidase
MLEYTSQAMGSASASPFLHLPTAYALRSRENVAAEDFPQAICWEQASAIRFDRDWRGANVDPERSTEVRLLWNPETLFVRFVVKFRELNVFPDARPDGWRDRLWERDVAEAFLQPDDSDPLIYKELEVAPNGYWIDLNIAHGEKEEMRSGLRRRVWQDTQAKSCTAELTIPMRSLTPAFDPQKPWRANFFRVEGRTEPRFYAAWSPTMTPEPNFHVPAAFGHLVFRES